MQGEEVANVEDLKYMGSTVQSNGECGREAKKRVQAGWHGWTRMSGVICDRRVPARVKCEMTVRCSKVLLSFSATTRQHSDVGESPTAVL